mmetsp:Transcript_12590/g.27321  ORF Transcript_12590/g.27321 Transcript_12590/m.27321 type:complete len:84 (-) Transcript_12590:413-664(-)
MAIGPSPPPTLTTYNGNLLLMAHWQHNSTSASAACKATKFTAPIFTRGLQLTPLKTRTPLIRACHRHCFTETIYFQSYLYLCL